jgi:hypothetical protein
MSAPVLLKMSFISVISYHLYKPVKEIAAVLGARRVFRVILDGKYGQVLMS